MDVQKKGPTPVEYLRSINPAAADAFVALRHAAAAGPLDEHMCELVVLGTLAVTGQEGSFKVHAKRVIATGGDPAAIRQAVLATLGATTTFSQVVTALKWIDDVAVA
ncbi:MAG TPA: carboxymuconolactone decarboxylase family protein [Pararobbsia sp.]|jgi:alkylhydroperoxidase/carboxymuconolactone decarboxylase family protein YurZ|nr:carboxymuconolactone decarboxylase family protein [Pararobbsia sp.]